MKNILTWLFCIIFAFSAIRVTLNIPNYPDYLLPDSYTEIPYDSEGERLSFYEYYQMRKSYNSQDYLPFRDFLQVLSSFEVYEFNSYQHLRELSDSLTYLIENLLEFEPENFLDTVIHIVAGLFSIVFTVTYYSFIGFVPVITDVISLILVIFDLIFTLLQVAI